MARPLRLHIPGTLYHVTSRGNAKQQIFVDDTDNRKFMELLAKGLARFGVWCSGYCLMWNHVHLLLTPGEHAISRLMQQILGSYARWFNRRHGRCGHLLQGRPDIRLVDNSVYFLRVHRYVARNPVKAQYVLTPAAWGWSSYRATAGLAPVPEFLQLETLWRSLDRDSVRRAQQMFRSFCESPEDDEVVFPRLLCGPREFARTVEPKLGAVQHVREYSYAERFAARPSLNVLLGDGAVGAGLKAAVRNAFQTHAYTLAEIASVLGCHPGTVWYWINKRGASNPRVCSRRSAAKGRRKPRP